jgi:hypothetical protein
MSFIIAPEAVANCDRLRVYLVSLRSQIATLKNHARLITDFVRSQFAAIPGFFLFFKVTNCDLKEVTFDMAFCGFKSSSYALASKDKSWKARGPQPGTGWRGGITEREELAFPFPGIPSPTPRGWGCLSILSAKISANLRLRLLPLVAYGNAQIDADEGKP